LSKSTQLLSVVAVFLGAVGCKPKPPPATTSAPPPAGGGDAVAVPATLDQGWDDAAREAFWFAPQGAQVMPYRWFLALERADGPALFRGAASMERYRYIPMPPSRLNPDGLPIGFTRDTDGDTGAEFLGLTCAACHTAKLNLGGKEVIIDGGPTLADFKTFLHDLNEAFAATLRDDAKLARFADRVSAGQADKNPVALRADVQRWADALRAREKNDQTKSPYGFSRLDAFGAIINNVAAAELNVPENAAPPDAPVSYPFIWDAPFADRVQWNGAALNVPVVGPLLRNVGEVLGVFGRLDIRPKKLSLDKGYDNSVNLESLGRVENMLKVLWSPSWPTQHLPAVDASRAARGAKIYDGACASCHARLDARDPARSFKVVMTPVGQVGTDPKMARNYLDRKAKTGVLAGQPLMIVAGPKLGAESRSFEIVVNGVTGVILRHPLRALGVGVADFRRTQELRKLAPAAEAAPQNDEKAMLTLRQRLDEYLAQLRQPFDATSFAYKARPLNGIWATAPYLHNGSVPNLWSLLQPGSKRPRKFYVGSRDFDAKNVGLVSEETAGSFEFDASAEGNSNLGHEYGTALSDDDKWALVEFLKTL
jgi:mono/diheme cytochrome c family protein